MSGNHFVGSQEFSPPGGARHSTNGARRSRRGSAATSLDARLPIIEEDQPSPTLPPEEPPKTYHRPYYQRFRSNPPIYTDKSSPPEYSVFNNILGPKGEKFDDLRNNKLIAGRGGLRRLCIIGFLLFLIVIGVVVGLAVGLTKAHHNSSAPAASNATAANNATAAKGPFPVGSWTFTTFLETASSNCTSNPLSWTCEPKQTYAQSPSGSQAIFNWIITDSSPTATNFSISSTDNPFAITFANTTLTLVDEGTSNERYTFKVSSVPKIVYPSANVKCYYNSTTFAGDLYTKKPKSYPSGGAAASSSAAPAAASSTSLPSVSDSGSASSSQPYAEWAFAVDAAQSINGGVDVPDCYSWNNGVDGPRVTKGYTVEPISNFCSCAYANYH